MTERIDLDALRQMIKNPHAYPMVMFTEGLEYCINELENARTTIAEDEEYIRGVDERIRRYRDLSSKSSDFLRGLIRESERIIKERNDDGAFS